MIRSSIDLGLADLGHAAAGQRSVEPIAAMFEGRGRRERKTEEGDGRRRRETGDGRRKEEVRAK